MLDSQSLDPLDDAYFRNDMPPEPVPALDKLESEAQAVEQLLSGGGSLTSLTDAQLRALLAYKYWDDGADDDEFILSVWKTDQAWTRSRVIETLVEVFGYSL